jgi:hypothetical protein
MCFGGKGAGYVSQLGCKVGIWKQPKSGTCANLDPGAHAGPVPVRPREIIGTSYECIVLIYQNEIVSWLPQACF